MAEDAKNKKFKGNRGQGEGPGETKALCYSKGERLHYYGNSWNLTHMQRTQKERYFHPETWESYERIEGGWMPFDRISRGQAMRCAALTFTPRFQRTAESNTEVPMGHTIMPGGNTKERRMSYLDRRSPRLGLLHHGYARNPHPSNRPADTFYDERPTNAEPLKVSHDIRLEHLKGNPQSEISALETDLQDLESRGSFAGSPGRRGSAGGRGSVQGPPRASISAAPRGSVMAEAQKEAAAASK